MNTKEKLKTIIVTIICLFLLGGCSFFTFTPTGKAIINNYFFTMQKVDDRTLYETRKKVEDQCRAMITSYQKDKLMYEQYKDSDDKLEKSWSQQAKTRANGTAVKYNEYVLKNSFVFEGNVPIDIYMQLEILE